MKTTLQITKTCVSLRALNLVTLAAMASLVVGTACATIAYDNSTGLPLQNWPDSLGLDFNVNAPTDVTALGDFDNGSIANLIGVDGSSGVTVQIYNRDTASPVGPSVTFTPTLFGTQINGDAFMTISTLVLPAGDYSIVAFNDENYNQGFYGGANGTSVMNSGGGLISFVGSGRYNYTGSGIAFPTVVDGGPVNRYDAGTFEFSAVPEPTTLIAGALLLLPFGASTLRILRRNRVA